jgi:hypothetical protein
MTGDQISYDLRRLPPTRSPKRVPQSHSYQLTAHGLPTALFSPG